MKKLFFYSILSLAALASVQNSKAQNSLDLKWGYAMPLNDQLNNSFYNPGSFSIALLHPLSRPAFQAGIKFSHEKYKSKEDPGTSAYCNSITIHHYLITARYSFVQNQSLDLYTDLDAGLNRCCKTETKNGISNTLNRNGATAGVGIGLELKISSRVLIGTNIKIQYAYTDNLEYNDKITTNYVLNAAANIGIRMLLKQKS